jgi:rsbT co-antagonist protein RsbR
LLHASLASLDSLPIPLIVVHESASPVFVNAAMRKLRGVDSASDTESASSLRELLDLSTDDAATLEDAVRGVLRGDRARNDLEFPEAGARGGIALTITPFPLQLSVQLSPRAERGALITIRHIRSILGVVDSAAERLERLVEGTSKAVFLHDGHAVVDANPAMERVFGYRLEEVVGMPIAALFQALEPLEGLDPPSKAEDFVGWDGESTPPRMTASARCKDGSTFPAEIVTWPLGGTSLGLYGVTIRDLAVQREAELAFADSEERLRILSELSAEGLVLTEGGVIFHANSAMVSLFGYTREELMGMSAVDLTAPEDRQIAFAHIRSGAETPYEARGLRKDGSMFMGSITGTAVPYQGRLVRGTRIRDITAENEAAEMLRQTVVQEEQIRAQAQRLAEMATPLIPITDEVVAMPLIGSMDADRAQQALETMLEGIAKNRAHTAIVDVTGVTSMDSGVAAALVRLAHAVRLLGAQVVLTGIRPEMGQALALLDVDLAGITIKGTFQNGIAFAMQTKNPARGGRLRR